MLQQSCLQRWLSYSNDPTREVKPAAYRLPDGREFWRDLERKVRKADMRNGFWFVVVLTLTYSSCSPGSGEAVFQPPTVTHPSISVPTDTASSVAQPPGEATVLEVEIK